MSKMEYDSVHNQLLLKTIELEKKVSALEKWLRSEFDGLRIQLLEESDTIGNNYISLKKDLKSILSNLVILTDSTKEKE